MRAQKLHRRAEREEELGLPPRPSARRGERREIPDLRWQMKAACASADDIDAHTLTESLSQQEAAEVANRLCSRCPVKDACLEAGRSSLAWGVWGGFVLTDGWLAPDRPAVVRKPRGLASVPVPEPVEETAWTKASGRQRWQPRRAPSRARRRGRR